MKKFSVFMLVMFTVSLQAVTITQLFDAIKKQPTTKIDEISSQMAQIAQKRVNAGYYPKLDLFANYTHYNSPTNLRPLSPTTRFSPGEPLPFSNTIEKIGVSASIPIFIKELGNLSQKAKYLAKSARLKKELNFYQNEALILGSNASLGYLDNLLLSLNATKSSLKKTRKDIEISVNSGRMPGIAIDKIDEKLNQLNITINNIEIQKANLVANIENLTGIEIKRPAKLRLVKEIIKGDFFALKPLQEVIKAAQSDFRASKTKRYYPKIALNVMWSENYAQNDVKYGKSVHDGYGFYQLGFSMPLYSRGEDIDMQLRKVEIMKNKMKLKKSEQELKAQVNALQKELKLLERSRKLKSEDIKRSEDLLKYAKVSFDEGRMTEEDYLVYEDKVLSAKSSYFETTSKRWQDIAKLAVIYGNDLKGVVR